MILKKKFENYCPDICNIFLWKEIWYLIAKDWLKLGKNVHFQLVRPTVLLEYDCVGSRLVTVVATDFLFIENHKMFECILGTS